MTILEQFKNLIISRDLLNKATFNIDDIDSLLDSRDEGEFDSKWMRNYEILKEKISTIDIKEKDLIDVIREISFKIVYDETESSDLAAYVSDDFGLIAEALSLKYNDEWLNALGKMYVGRKIPHGQLNPCEGELDKIIFK